MIYLDGESGKSFAKRFNVTGITRDKEYDLTKGHEKSKVHYLSINPNGEAELVKIALTAGCSARIKDFDFYFEELAVKGRSSMGNQVTRYPIRAVKLKEKGKAVITGNEIWFDDSVGRLNNEQKGMPLGTFVPGDKILVIYADGNYELFEQDVNKRFEPENVLLIEKFDAEKIITAVYLDQAKVQYSIKRFKIETTTTGNRFFFIKEGEGNRLENVTTHPAPILSVSSGRGAQIRKAKFKVEKMVEVMGWKANGVKLVDYSKSVEMEWENPEAAKGQQKELF
jgi:topoisomerase-4 subunit A